MKAKKCKVCGKILGINNQSMLCSHHAKEKWLFEKGYKDKKIKMKYNKQECARCGNEIFEWQYYGKIEGKLFCKKCLLEIKKGEKDENN